MLNIIIAIIMATIVAGGSIIIEDKTGIEVLDKIFYFGMGLICAGSFIFCIYALFFFI